MFPKFYRDNKLTIDNLYGEVTGRKYQKNKSRPKKKKHIRGIDNDDNSDIRTGFSKPRRILNLSLHSPPKNLPLENTLTK
jgi:hypothetical protein